MPKILEGYVSGMTRGGMDKSKAFAIATANLQRKGILKEGTQELAYTKDKKHGESYRKET